MILRRGSNSSLYPHLKKQHNRLPNSSNTAQTMSQNDNQAIEASSSSASNVSFALSYRGQTYEMSIDRHGTLQDLYDCIAEQTGVLPMHQKIVASGPLKRVFASSKQDDVEQDVKTLDQLGFYEEAIRQKGNQLKLMLVGPRQEEVASVRREDERSEKFNAPRNYHPSLLRGTRPRTTAKQSASNLTPFHSLRVHASTLQGSPTYDLIMNRLRQLSTDDAVLHVCRLHNFRIGELTELLPHEHPNLLGLNENMGQRISLRLRTDLYDGLQPYRDTRRVLLHELAHNKINDHPPEFKTLNSLLNAQVEAFERAKKQGTHSLLGDGDIYIPSDVDENAQVSSTGQQTTNVLGGNSSSIDRNADATDVQSRRQRVLEATMKRLEHVEADIERGCGSSTT